MNNIDNVLDTIQSQLKNAGINKYQSDLLESVKELKKTYDDKIVINEEKIDFGKDYPLIKKSDVQSVFLKKPWFGKEYVVVRTSNGDIPIYNIPLSEVKNKLK